MWLVGNVHFEELWRLRGRVILTKRLQHLFHLGLSILFEVRNLHNYCVVRQTVEKVRLHHIGYRLRFYANRIGKVVNDGLRNLNLLECMPQNVYRNDVERFFLLDIHILKLLGIGIFAPRLFVCCLGNVGIGVFTTKIGAETHYLSVKIRFLKFDSDYLAVIGVGVDDCGGEVEPQNPHARLFLDDWCVVGDDVEFGNFALQEARQQQRRRPLVLHHIFECRIIYGICKILCHCSLF